MSGLPVLGQVPGDVDGHCFPVIVGDGEVREFPVSTTGIEGPLGEPLEVWGAHPGEADLVRDGQEAHALGLGLFVGADLPPDGAPSEFLLSQGEVKRGQEYRQHSIGRILPGPLLLWGARRAWRLKFRFGRPRDLEHPWSGPWYLWPAIPFGAHVAPWGVGEVVHPLLYLLHRQLADLEVSQTGSDVGLDLVGLLSDALEPAALTVARVVVDGIGHGVGPLVDGPPVGLSTGFSSDLSEPLSGHDLSLHPIEHSNAVSVLIVV